MRILSFFKNKKSTAYAPAYLAYLDCFAKKKDRKKPVREARFVVLDTETTGLDPRRDRILSIAAMEVTGGQFSVNNRLEFLVKQPDYRPGESIAIHGILQNQSEGGVEEREALELLLALLKDAVMVGHYIGFDMAVLNAAMKRNMGGPLKNKVLDTAILARRIEDPFKIRQMKKEDFSLDNLCEKYHIPLGTRHTAAGDVFITALLFLKLVGRLERKGVRMLRELLR